MKDRQPNLLPDVLQFHPPERGEHKKKYVVLYSCCCCCCCCLHTLGSAIAVASVKNFKPNSNVLSTQSMFWISTLAANLLTFIGISCYGIDSWGMLAIMVLLGPLILLGACLLMAIWISMKSDLPERGQYFEQLEKMSGGVIFGCVGGILVMVALSTLLLVVR